MELFKRRDFNAFFQDTFAFLKQHGKHFFTHFFIINGVFLLILMILGYFLITFYTEIFFGGMLRGNQSTLDEFMNQNGGLFIIFIVAFLIIGVLAALIAYAFPPIYLKLYTSSTSKDFGSKEIIGLYKKNSGKLLIFLVCSIILFIPIGIIVSLVSFGLTITIIGVLLIPVIIGMMSLFYGMALMEYLGNEKGIWECFGYSWKLLTSKFMAAVGSVGIFFLMSYLIQNVVTVIAYIFGMVRMLTSIEERGSLNPESFSSTMSILMILMFIAGFILNAFLTNIVFLNQGIVYYSLKEENENINAKSIIDQIGSGE